MSAQIGNNKRVIKNTIYLYVRMFITVIVSLYTSRIVLQYLGVVDYGILNVVGGFVSMFSFITSTMTNASTRFFSFGLGKNDTSDLLDTFKTTITIYLYLIVAIFLLAETIGLWFVWNKLNIPPERHSAAMFVYQISLVTFFVGLLRIPYNASIIAHENMNFYAFTSIIEAILKLIIVYLLTIAPFDKLVFYNFMFLMVSVGITLWYAVYCKRFAECKFGLCNNKEKFKTIFGFAGWNFTSNMGDVAIDQGINILINIFFGPAINAARGIAYQIKGQVASFCTNFQTAAAPQITKYYAVGDTAAMSKLVLQSSKVSFYLMLIMSLPVYVGMDLILNIWLKEVPNYTLILSRLALVNIVCNAFGGTINIAIQATGRIKRYVLELTAAKFLAFFLTLISFKYYNAPPEYSIYCTILFAILSIVIQLIKYQYIQKGAVKEYIREVLIRGLIVSTVSVLLLVVLGKLLFNSDSLVSKLCLMVFSVVIACVMAYLIGMDTAEKQMVRQYIKRKVSK